MQSFAHFFISTHQKEWLACIPTKKYASYLDWIWCKIYIWKLRKTHWPFTLGLPAVYRNYLFFLFISMFFHASLPYPTHLGLCCIIKNLAIGLDSWEENLNPWNFLIGVFLLLISLLDHSEFMLIRCLRMATGHQKDQTSN